MKKEATNDVTVKPVLNYSNGPQCSTLEEKSSALTFIDLNIL